MKYLINKILDRLLEYKKSVGRVNFLLTIIVCIAVIIKFTVFYSLVHVTANLAFVIMISCSITGLILASFRNKWIPVILYLLVSFMMFCDLTYFSFFNRYLSLSMLGAAEVVGDIGESIKQVLRPANFIMFLDALIMAGALIYNKVPFKQKRIMKFNRADLRNPVIIIVFISLIVTNVPQFNFFTSISNQEIYSYRVKDTVINTIGMGADDSFAISNEYEEQKNGPIFGAGAGRNLIVIQLESLQDFVIGLEYNGQEVTPNINRLIAGNSIYFEHYYQQTGSGNTSDAEFATNNSMLGVLKSYTYKIYKDNYFRGLPALLKEKGYDTAVFHAHESKGFWNREDIYPKMGFDSFYGGLKNDTQGTENGSYEMTEWMGWGLTDSEFYEQTVPLMEELQEPFYSFVISLSNHHPYIMLDKYDFIELLPEDEGTLAGNYLNSAAYTDYALGKYLDALKENGLYDKSIIAIYGDHSGLVNNEETNQVMERMLGKKYDFEEALHIPLIVNLPEEAVTIKQTVSTAGGQLDFLPTIAYLMGFDRLDTIYQGQNLLTATSGFVAEHTFMVKGSFFKDEIAYEMSRDGIFENGRAWDIENGAPVSLDGLYEDYLKSVEISDTSQYLLDHNVLGKIYQEGQSVAEALK